MRRRIFAVPHIGSKGRSTAPRILIRKGYIPLAKNATEIATANVHKTTKITIGLVVIFFLLLGFIITLSIPTILLNSLPLSKLVVTQVFKTDLGPDGLLNAGDVIIIEVNIFNNGTDSEVDIVVNCTFADLTCPSAKRFGLEPGQNKTCIGTYIITQDDIDNESVFESTSSTMSKNGTTGANLSPVTSDTITLGIDDIAPQAGCRKCVFNETSLQGNCFALYQNCTDDPTCTSCVMAYQSETNLAPVCGMDINWQNLQACLCMYCASDCMVPPTAVCLNGRTNLFLDGSGSFVVDAMAMAPDSVMVCDPLMFTSLPPVVNCSHIGNQTLMIEVEHNGLQDHCMVDVAVIDNIAPTAICQNITIDLDMAGMAEIMSMAIDGGSDDNCVFTKTINMDMFNCSNVPTSMATLTVTDASGNSDQCTTTITVNDVTPPSLICSDIVVMLDGSGMAMIAPIDAAMFNDECGISSMTINPDTFSCPDALGPPITYTAEITDINMNSVQCNINTVTVQDTTVPTAQCQVLVMINLDANGDHTYAPGELDNGSNDNCGISSSSVSPPSVTGCPTSALATLNVQDPSGNMDSCMSMVSFNDITPPVVSCSDITRNLDGTGMASIGVGDVATITEACGVMSSSVMPNAFTCADALLGPQSYTTTVIDTSSNMGSCSSNTVEIQDMTSPTAVCQNIGVTLAMGSATIMANQLDGGSTDNCGVSFSANQTTFTSMDVPSVSVTLTVTDPSGNMDTCISTVTVDTGAVLITCPADIVKTDGQFMEDYASLPTPADPGFCETPVFSFEDDMPMQLAKKEKTKQQTVTHDDAFVKVTSKDDFSLGNYTTAIPSPQGPIAPNITMIDPSKKRNVPGFPSLYLSIEDEVTSSFTAGSGSFQQIDADTSSSYKITVVQDTGLASPIVYIDNLSDLSIRGFFLLTSIQSSADCATFSSGASVIHDITANRWIIAAKGISSTRVCLYVSNIENPFSATWQEFFFTLTRPSRNSIPFHIGYQDSRYIITSRDTSKNNIYMVQIRRTELLAGTSASVFIPFAGGYTPSPLPFVTCVPLHFKYTPAPTTGFSWCCHVVGTIIQCGRVSLGSTTHVPYNFPFVSDLDTSSCDATDQCIDTSVSKGMGSSSLTGGVGQPGKIIVRDGAKFYVIYSNARNREIVIKGLQMGSTTTFISLLEIPGEEYIFTDPDDPTGYVLAPSIDLDEQDQIIFNYIHFPSTSAGNVDYRIKVATKKTTDTTFTNVETIFTSTNQIASYTTPVVSGTGVTLAQVDTGDGNIRRFVTTHMGPEEDSGDLNVETAICRVLGVSFTRTWTAITTCGDTGVCTQNIELI